MIRGLNLIFTLLFVVIVLHTASAQPNNLSNALPPAEVNPIGADVEKAYWACRKYRRVQQDLSMYPPEWQSCVTVEAEWAKVVASRRAASDLKNAEDRKLVEDVLKSLPK